MEEFDVYFILESSSAYNATLTIMTADKKPKSWTCGIRSVLGIAEKEQIEAIIRAYLRSDQ